MSALTPSFRAWAALLKLCEQPLVSKAQARAQQAKMAGMARRLRVMRELMGAPFDKGA